MSEFTDAFELYNIIVDLPPRIREQQLYRLCDDAELIESVKGLLAVQEDSNTLSDLFSQELGAIRQGDFNHETLTGIVIGQYRIQYLIDQGAMGYVFYAVRDDNRLEHQAVAIKVIKPHLADIYNYDLLDREANIMAKLSKHQYIAHILDAGVFDFDGYKLPFYVMEYIDGRDIVSYFDSPFLSIKSRIEAVVKICQALSFSYQQGIIHNDIKPQNVLINSLSEPKILDFGFSRQLKNDDSVSDIRKKYAEFFQSDYFPPELTTKPSPKHDVYALGTLLYALLTGITPPFDIQNKPASKHLTHTLGKNPYKMWLPELDKILFKATNKAPENRYSDVLSLADDLNKFLEFDVASVAPSRCYRWFKYAFVHPIHASMATMGAVLSCFFVFAFSYLVLWYQNQSADMVLERDLVNIYQSHNLGHRQAIEQAFSEVKASDKASDDVRYQALNYIGRQAFKDRHYRLARETFSFIQKNQLGDILDDALLIKAIALDGDTALADKLAEQYRNDITQQWFLSRQGAKAFLELLSVNVRQLVDTSVIDFLSDIKETHQLTGYYAALLDYHLANELYYHYVGDNVSPSTGYPDDYYQRHLRPMFRKALDLVNDTRNIRFEDADLSLLLSGLHGRLMYEIGLFEQGRDTLNYAIAEANRLWPQGDNINQTLYRGLYSVTRFHDLPGAISAINGANRHKAPFGHNGYFDDNYFINAYLLVDSYIYAGNQPLAQQTLSDMLRLYKQKDIRSRLSVAGLDSLYVAIIRYMEFTGFERSDRFIAQHINTFIDVTKDISKANSEFFDDYELALIDLYVSYYKEQNNIKQLTKSLMEQKLAASDMSNSDTDYSVLINCALILFNLGDSEYASFLAQRAESLITVSQREKALSPVYMQNHFFLAKIYHSNGLIEQAKSSFNTARLVYEKHETHYQSSYYYYQLVELNTLLFS
ncbi:serine/threonine protein kinase [Endozoicomonas sp. G2_1]|uniref:serine/threonine-protein kinase n=1 Tax=Endozoicomonas sp. G2_1 TaxID=2821091 RepID=UPI001AD973EA|nr:serine/threonine-protein kinase [Endozoicomonas sp. G2_1]MBO9492198.1 serine/threonine protein kinase [Endozoicomonas sp. G2_1]